MRKPPSIEVSWTEVANALVIAVAGLLISFATYQGALWSGKGGLDRSRAAVLHTESAALAARAETREMISVQVFAHWFDAAVRNEHALADKYAARFPAGMRPAFEAWIALRPFENPAAPASPFTMPQYTMADAAAAADLQRKANALFRRGERAGHIADTYGQAATLLSIALFFAGISQVFTIGRVRLALLALAVLACGLGLVRVVTLPMMTVL